MDTDGSEFIANGFSDGSLGMQITGDGERRIVFSVNGGNLVRKGDNTEVEGASSYIEVPIKTELTYGFLVQGVPNGSSTDYTAWYNTYADGWSLIASFKVNTVSQSLYGWYSSSFPIVPEAQPMPRMCWYTRHWAYDVEGEWWEANTAVAGPEHMEDDDAEAGTFGQNYFLKHQSIYEDATKKWPMRRLTR